MPLKIVIANRLRDGRVVYLGAQGWTAEIAAARIAEREDAAETLLAHAKQSIGRCEIVDPYLIEVVVRDGVLSPVDWRERIRALGPTVRPDLGHQAGEPA
jgi:hypothetical protein